MKASGTNRKWGFTLIEILIVVVIMAILAATIIPQLSSSTNDARESTLNFNRQSLRAQIELYRIHHNGRLPQVQNEGLPQLTSMTNAQGQIGTGEGYTFGPYIEAIPINPFDGKSRVVAVNLGGARPTAVADGNGGWQYDPNTGAIWPNNPEFFQ